MCRTFPDAADLFSGVNALCRHGICRQSSTSENAVFVEIQQRCIVNSEVADLYVRRESDPNKRVDDIFNTPRLRILFEVRVLVAAVHATSERQSSGGGTSVNARF